jgi:ATP-dependent Clp protease protease subunit
MTSKDLKDFNLYARDKGISSLGLHYHNQKIENSLTPYILEERNLNVTQMDVFSRLLMERILFITGEVNDNMAVITQAQLLFLDKIDENVKQNRDIIMYINTGGGSVLSGLSMVATMDYIDSDVCTINTGMAASMGSVLLGAGTKGKRAAIRFSKVMLHQVSAGAVGNVQDMRIQLEQTEKYNVQLFELLGKYCDKTPEQVLEDSERDFWLDEFQSLEYGIIDEIIIDSKTRKKK